MFDIIGRHNRAIVYANQIDPTSYAQVLQMCNLPELKDSRIRMMPDMHASEGCTVGTSLTIGDRVNPAYVGGDIGSGMQVYCLTDKQIDFAAFDQAVRQLIPSGAAIRERAHPRIKELPLNDLHIREAIRYKTVVCSLGTLGGGNHFIEIDRGLDGRLYMVVHSGSRRLGRDVARYYMKAGHFAELGLTMAEVRKMKAVPYKGESAFLHGELMTQYLHDMNIAVEYALLSRRIMAESLIEALDLDVQETFATVHNYIDTEHGVLRKGAVSAQKGERLIIPINMRDGSLICTGKGNEDWNCTAPHGSGRVMTRSEAKETVSLEEYRAAMAGIYSTSVSESTLDESPMAYRPIEDILDTIDPTAEVTEIITPVYNFKASKAPVDEETMDGND